MLSYDVDNQSSNKLKSLIGKFSGAFGAFALLGLSIFGALLVNSFVFQPYQVDGSSMSPTLENGERLIVLKLGKTWHRVFGGEFTPKRGDIVVFDRPGSDTQLIKRVIGLPGERVLVKDQVVTVFNSEFPDGFDVDMELELDDLDPVYGDVETKVNEDEVFVLGDNRVRGGSLDSRSSLGPVPIENVVGTLEMRIYPANKFKTF